MSDREHPIEKRAVFQWTVHCQGKGCAARYTTIGTVPKAPAGWRGITFKSGRKLLCLRCQRRIS